MSSSYILGNRVDALTLDGAVSRVAQYIETGAPHQVVTLNAEIAYRAAHDARLQQIIGRAALVTADGSGIIWAARTLGCPLPQRVTRGDHRADPAAAAGAVAFWELRRPLVERSAKSKPE